MRGGWVGELFLAYPPNTRIGIHFEKNGTRTQAKQACEISLLATLLPYLVTVLLLDL